MYFILSVPAATIPVLLAVFLIWWLDRYDREPLRWMAMCLVWGGTFAIALSILGTSLLKLLFVDDSVEGFELIAAQAVHIAPFVEEICKILVFVFLFLVPDFDNATDGFVYGATVGLGFAMTENFLYFNEAGLLGGDWLQRVAMRNFLTGPMHAVATATLGACIGHIKYHRSALAKLLLPLAGLFMAWGIHFSWNWLVIEWARGESPYLIYLAVTGLFLEIGFAAFVFGVSLHYEHETLKLELSEEARGGTLPETHVPFLASYFKRRRRDWCPEIIDLAGYVKAATRLAFRRHQWRHSPPETQKTLEADMQLMRHELAKLRGAAPMTAAQTAPPPQNLAYAVLACGHCGASFYSQPFGPHPFVVCPYCGAQVPTGAMPQTPPAQAGPYGSQPWGAWPGC